MMDARVVSLAKRIQAKYDRLRETMPHVRWTMTTISGLGIPPRPYPAKGWFDHCTMPLGQALEYARNIIEGEDRGLIFNTADESEPWDGDSPAPTYLFWCYVTHESDDTERGNLASIGMVGVNSLNDPYLDTCKADLFREAMDDMDAAADREACEQATALAARATYAGNVQP